MRGSWRLGSRRALLVAADGYPGHAEIVLIIFAGTSGFLDKVAVKDVARFEDGLLAHMRSKHQDVLDWITNEDPKIKGDAEDKVKAVLDEYAADFA